MGKGSTIGLDLAKNVFQAHDADESGAVVFRKKLRREQVLGAINCVRNIGELIAWLSPQTSSSILKGVCPAAVRVPASPSGRA